MGSTLNYWIYWHFFTIPINYDSSQSMTVYDSLHSLLDHERLLFHCDQWRTTSVWRTTPTKNLLSSESESYVTTKGQSASLSWNKAPIWGLRPDFYCCLGFLMWGDLSDERTDLPFAIAAGPRQRSHSRLWVPWDSQPYFTVSDSRLPFPSPPTTRKATMEVFDPASTRDLFSSKSKSHCDWLSVNQ
jgi:hypothetical protein